MTGLGDGVVDRWLRRLFCGYWFGLGCVVYFVGVFWMVWPNIGFGCSWYLVRWVFLVGVVGVVGWFAIALCGVHRGLGLIRYGGFAW